MTTYPISPTKWDVLKRTSPDTQVVLTLIVDSAAALWPGNEIIVHPLFDKPCGSVTVRELISVGKFQSRIVAAVAVSGFLLRDDITAYDGGAK